MINFWLDSSRKKERRLKSINLEVKKEKLQLILQKYRDYCKQQYVNKMDNLEEMDKFLERYNLPRLNQKEIENVNRPITSTEVESVI